MKRLLVILFLLWFACEEGTEPETVSLGEPFTLACGESALVEVGAEEIEVGFQAVLGDSRCPLDADCIWRGRAEIQLWLYGENQDTVYLELGIYGYVFREDTTTHESIYTAENQVTLLQLDPYPTVETTQPSPADYVALLSVSLNPVPPEAGRINMVDSETFEEYLKSPSDPFVIDSVAVVADTLVAGVCYIGGCTKHSFYLIGSRAWAESVPPQMSALLIHDAHGDDCLAAPCEIRRFDLSPIREWRGSGGTVVIHVKEAPDSVLYHY